MNDSPLRHWLPYKLQRQPDALLCRWLYAGEKRFTEPFFDETIGKCLSHAYNSQRFRVVSDLAVLPGFGHQVESLAPAAFIFHISRCGSTLLSQVLSVSPATVVLSEVPFLDEMLHLPLRTGLPLPQAGSLFTAAVALYGQKRFAQEQHLFIKTDSWHVLFWQQIRRLYPHVPFLLLYRRPDEVIRSHQHQRGMQAVPGLLEPVLFGLKKEAAVLLPPDIYTAIVLEKFFSAFLQVMQQDGNAVLANYNEGPQAIVAKLTAKAGVSFTAAEGQAMEQRAGFHAKHPGQAFAERQLSSTLPDLRQCFLFYEALERLRQAE